MNHLAIGLAIAALGWALMPASTLAAPEPHPPHAASDSQRPARTQQGGFVSPEQLSRDLKRQVPPIVLQVGLQSLYQQSHVPGALHFQGANTPEGKATFLEALDQLPEDRDIVLYCGCCSFDMCPFIQPAFSAANTLRGERIKVLFLPKSFEEDWVAKGYPVQKP